MPKKRSSLDPDPSPETIFRELRKIAPDIAFSIYWGDNPNPVPLVMTQEQLQDMLKEGFREHDVEASALTVVDDVVVEGKRVLTGFMYKPGERDPALDGFLPEMLLSAVQDLSAKLDDRFPQAHAAVEYLKEVRQRWSRN